MPRVPGISDATIALMLGISRTQLFMGFFSHVMYIAYGNPMELTKPMLSMMQGKRVIKHLYDAP